MSRDGKKLTKKKLEAELADLKQAYDRNMEAAQKQNDVIAERFNEMRSMAMGMSLVVMERDQLKMENYQLHKTVEKAEEFLEMKGLTDEYTVWFEKELEKFKAEQEAKRKEAEKENFKPDIVGADGQVMNK